MARAVARATASAARVNSVISPRLRPDWPVPRANRVSPSLMVCTGLMARASPSWATVARRWAWGLVIWASVATTPRVVLLPARMALGASPRSSASRAPSNCWPSAVRAPASSWPVCGW